MKITRLKIRNFRGIKCADLLFPDHVVLIGDNNTGKSTVLEAIDLVLGPDRLRRRAPIDEHDFYQGRYLPAEHNESEQVPKVELELSQNTGTESDDNVREIIVEASLIELSSEQKAHFIDYIEWWDRAVDQYYTASNVQRLDDETVVEALRVTFIGRYLMEEDDFEGQTYYARSLEESIVPARFWRRDKQICSFFYLRGLRTGRRALSLEHGSLLDVILRIKEIRPQMWEKIIGALKELDVAREPELGISTVLESIGEALHKYVPKEWGINTRLRISALTRDHLREVITAFIGTGAKDHSAPYYRQGTGTVNMLVLAMLSQIADDSQHIIFAMEEPETAVPPYAQKRIVHALRELSTQTIFTSHSPYVLEEYSLNETVVLSRDDGVLTQADISLPDSVKLKRYRQEFRTRFCEGLLSRRILIGEGATEAAGIPAVARRLAELAPTKYSSLEALGICTIDAGSETQILDLCNLYKSLDKTVFAICDKRSKEDEALMRSRTDELFMHSERGFEDLVLNNTTTEALQRFAALVTWPDHLVKIYPRPYDNAAEALGEYFRWSKGNWGIAEFLSQCEEEEIPQWLRDCCEKLVEYA